jgi:hypothetical protein
MVHVILPQRAEGVKDEARTSFMLSVRGRRRIFDEKCKERAERLMEPEWALPRPEADRRAKWRRFQGSD